MGEKFWVFEWLRENNVTSLEEAAALLGRSGGLKDFESRARRSLESKPTGRIKTVSVLAGSGIDLSAGGPSICPSPICMRFQVDKLFRRVWHYFDSIVVNDVLTPIVTEPEDRSSEDLKNAVLSHLAPLIYLREIDATDLVMFVTKWRCTNWQVHAEKGDLDRILQSKEALKEQLRATGRFFVTTEEDGPVHWLESSELDNSTGGLAFRDGTERTETEIQDALLEAAFDELLEELTADVDAARRAQLPLASAVGFHGRMLAASHDPTVADVVLRLELPVLDGVPTRDLVEIRRREHDSFVRFRSSLGAAIRERIKIGGMDGAASIAHEIRGDVIEPALDEIRQRLAITERALAKKSGVGMFLGALSTTCGLLCGLPPNVSVPAGVAAALAVTGPAASKYIDQQADVALSDMYFLWKATGHAHHDGA